MPCQSFVPIGHMKVFLNRLFDVIAISFLALQVCGKINQLGFIISHSSYIVAVFIAPIAEEGIKLLSLLWLSSRIGIQTRISGLAIGFCFGLFETYYYAHLKIISGIFLLGRMILTVPVHTITAGLSGCRKRYIIFSVIMHMTYNFIVINKIDMSYLLMFVWLEVIVCALIIFFSNRERRIETNSYLRRNLLGACITFLGFLLFIWKSVV